MAAQLAVGIGMVLLTVLIHGGGIFLLTRSLRIELRQEAERNIHPTSPRGMVVTMIVVFCLFVLHGIHIWAYAVVYRLVDAIETFDQAIYFSTITYSTTGYNSEGLSAEWQMIAAIEGLNGFLMLGWSTAFFVKTVAQLGRTK